MKPVLWFIALCGKSIGIGTKSGVVASLHIANVFLHTCSCSCRRNWLHMCWFSTATDKQTKMKQEKSIGGAPTVTNHLQFLLIPKRTGKCLVCAAPVSVINAPFHRSFALSWNFLALQCHFLLHCRRFCESAAGGLLSSRCPPSPSARPLVSSSSSIRSRRGRVVCVGPSGGGVPPTHSLSHMHTAGRAAPGGWRVLLSSSLNGGFVPPASVGRWGEGRGDKQRPVIMFSNRRLFDRGRRRCFYSGETNPSSKRAT